MDESEKRKQRLKAMRMEAAKSELASQNTLNPTGQLLNPLAQPDTSLPAHESSVSSPRFDYYTDPMSSFSSGKKRNTADSVNTPLAYSSSPGTHFPSPLPDPRNTNMIPLPAPAYQFQVNSSPYQGSYRAHSPILQPASQPSPAGTTSPFQVRSPLGGPNMQNRSPSPSSFFNPPHTSGGSVMSPRGRGSPNSNSGRGGQSMNSGRGGYTLRFANSPVPCRFGNSSGHSGNRSNSGRSGWTGGWKKDANGYASALKAPLLFYNRVMVMDPWEKMSPIVGSILVPLMTQRTPGSSSWLPASISTKKAKVDDGNKISRPGSSLAEYLALSFEEAANSEQQDM